MSRSNAEPREPVELSELQLAVMDVLWERGEAAVSEVHEALRHGRGCALTTVATTLTRLEKRGVVSHRQDGRQYLYRPEIPREDVRRSMVGALTERLFRGDPALLLNHLLTEQEIDPDELRRLKSLLEARTRERRTER